MKAMKLDDATKRERILKGHPDKPNDCWIWKGAEPSNQQFQLKYGQRIVSLNRLVYMVHFGPIPEDHVVSRTCGVTRCYNWAHLKLMKRETFMDERKYKPGVRTWGAPPNDVYFRNLMKLQGPSTDNKIAYRGRRLTITEFDSFFKSFAEVPIPEDDSEWYIAEEERISKERRAEEVAKVERRQHLRGKWISDADRVAIYVRDEYTCQLCGKKCIQDENMYHADNITLDHIMPYSKGGANTADNLRVACRSCNMKRGKRMDNEEETYV